jgi:hypothetical protein
MKGFVAIFSQRRKELNTLFYVLILHSISVKSTIKILSLRLCVCARTFLGFLLFGIGLQFVLADIYDLTP